jgi:hypothetical protein
VLRAAVRSRLDPKRVPFARLSVLGYKPGGRPGPQASPEAWDVRRTLPGYAFPESREAWVEEAEADVELTARAAAIAAIAQETDARSLCSYGAGVGMLEWCLHRAAPTLDLTCTDFAPRTVERLGALFPEATVVRHDLLRDAPIAADLALLHRVETELPDDAWRQVFAGLGPTLVVVSDFLRFGRLLDSRRRSGEEIGWLRTPRAVTALWRGSHTHRRLRVADLDGYLLSPRVRLP